MLCTAGTSEGWAQRFEALKNAVCVSLLGTRYAGPIGCSAKVEREVIKEEKYRYSCRFEKFVVGVQRSENKGNYCTTLVSGPLQ